MRHGELRLAIDYGSVSTTAVLAWPGGWLPLAWDGSPWLSSAVHVSADGRIETGQQAWTAAAAAPEGFEPSPLRSGQERLVLSGVEVAVVDLVAATLGRVEAEAARIAGGPVADVRLVVPGAWGPRRSTWLRRAAKRAGLPEVTVVAAPVAVADHLVEVGTPVPVGTYLAVCDLGAGVEASVLRRGPTGFEILSTLDDPGAGGARVDELLVAQLDGHHSEGAAVTGAAAWQQLANARMAKETLSVHPTVAVGVPPVVLAAGQVEAVARPVLERAARVTVEAVAAAELAPDQIAGVYLVGGGASMPAAARSVGEATGRAPVVVPGPGAVAVRGAAHAAGPPSGGVEAAALDTGPPGPPLRRALALIVPALASLALLGDHLWIRQRAGGDYDSVYRYRAYISPGNGFGGGDFMVKVNWGELGMAATLALVACLCAAALLASVLPVMTGLRGPAGSDGVQMGGGLLVATGLGLGAAALYAAGAAQYLVAPAAPFLKWTLLPVLPLVAVVVTVALLAARWGRRPVMGWHEWLRFPVGSVIPAAVGMLLVEYLHWTWLDTPLESGLERLGGLLIGVGAAFALVRPLAYRIVVAVPLGAVAAAITGVDSTGVLGMIYIVAVTAWWAQRLWHLVYRPPQPWLPAA